MSALSAFRTKFEDDPHWQTQFHKRMTYFWLVNMIAATVVFFFAPGLWAQAAVFYLVLVSLYANFATDYGAVSAAEASESADVAASH
jgi:hypothetical protein